MKTGDEGMGNRAVAVNIAELGDPDWDWLGGKFAEDPFRWLSFTGHGRTALGSYLDTNLVRPRLSRYRACWQGVGAARRERAKLIVTHQPLIAAWTGALYQTTGLDMPHLAFAFTFSNLPTGARREALRLAYRSVDRFVCFSSVERARYADYFDIPIEKIDMLRWSVADPDFDASEAPIEPDPYLCAVGSEGRDYGTLFEAMRLLPSLKLVVVARPENLVGLDVPDNVVVHQNIPLSDVWNIVAHAKLMVLPARDAEVPCGHGTLLIAMKLGTPSILTESVAMTDYVTPGETGLVCPPADPVAMSQSIQRLWDDEELASSLIRTGRQFASEECSESRTIEYFADYLKGRGLV